MPMPKGPKGGKRTAAVVGTAVKVMRIATGGEEADFPADDGKDAAAKSLGRRGGLARAKALTPKQRAEIARKQQLSDGRNSVALSCISRPFDPGPRLSRLLVSSYPICHERLCATSRALSAADVPALRSGKVRQHDGSGRNGR